MPEALWLLLGLQLRGWLRYLGRSLATVRGALLAVVGLTVLVFWMLMLLVRPSGAGGIPPEDLRRYGPALLLGYCLLNLLLSSGERAIYFSPAEVYFLFTGPFTRRQVLAYKILLTLLIGVPATLFMTAAVRVQGASLLASFLALLLLYAFMQLFAMALSLLATAVGARAYTRGRRLALAALLVAAVAAGLHFAGPPSGWRLRELAEEALNSPSVRDALTPLGWFFELWLAREFWPGLLYALLGVGVNLALAGLVLALDAQYLEAAASASARVYARLQRLRGRSVAGEESAGGGNVRWGLPDLPWWGGVGPILWRQLTTAARGPGRLVLLLVILGVLLAGPLSLGSLGKGAPPEVLLVVLLSVVVWLTIFLTALVPFDFRGDIDRLALLKTLPIPAWRLALGQLLTPVLLLSLIQWLALGFGAALAPPDPGLVLACAAYVPPFNFLLVALDNLLFLLFPTRLMASTPGDFQALGRNVVLMFAKLLGMFVVGASCFVAGLITFLLTHNWWAVAVAPWPVLAVAGACLLPLIAWAFRAFDVGRDTPA